MKDIVDRIRIWPVFVLVWILVAANLHAIEQPAQLPDKAQVTTQLGATVDLNLLFTNSLGETKPLKEYIKGGLPIIITPVYFQCPRLCGLVLDSFVGLLNSLDLDLGQHYQVLTISFNSKEKPKDAARRAEKYWGLYRNSQEAKSNWQFLIGEQAQVDAVMGQLGFHYAKDGGEFAHSVAVMILTPDGKISQFFTDINFPVRDVKLALVEASNGRIGSALDHFLLFCFRFDPTKGRYTWAAWNFLRFGVATCCIFSIAFVLRYARRKEAK